MPPRRRPRARLVRLLLVLAMLSVLTGVRTPAPTRAATVAVQTDTATVDFPQQITFHLVVDAPQPVTGLELRLSVANDPVTEVVRPQFQPGAHLDVSYQRGMLINYLFPGVELAYSWRLTEQDGSVLETPEKRVRYMDQRFQWITLTKGQVTLYYSGGDRPFAQEALDTTVRSLDRFKQAFGVQDDRPVTVLMYGSTRDFSSALPPNSAEWVGGQASPQLRLIMLGVQAGDTSEIHRILSHEAVHIVIAQVTNNPFNDTPRWLDEGLASYYQEVQDDRYDAILKQAIRAGRLDSVKALNSTFPDDPTLALLAYAESESIVRFIIETKGQDKMAALLHTFPEGVTYNNAVQKSLGISLDELDRQWKAWLEYRGDQPSATLAPVDGGTGGGAVGLVDYILAAAALLAVAGAGIVLARRRAARDRAL